MQNVKLAMKQFDPILFQTDMKNDSNPYYNRIRAVFGRLPIIALIVVPISVKNPVPALNLHCDWF